jgi:hypothetical protein
MAPLDEVLDAIHVKTDPGWNPTGPTIVPRLASDVDDGDLVWTRDGRGQALGRPALREWGRSGIALDGGLQGCRHRPVTH